MSTPMHPTSILSLDGIDKKVDQTLYRGMIDSLLYLTTSRPNIMFSVSLCAQFQVDPRKSHLTVVKRIFRYLKGTTNLGYNDFDFDGDIIERKNIGGGCHFIGPNLVSWSSKRQGTIALSMVEVEYISVAQCYLQLLWSNIPLLCDNTTKGNLDLKFINIENQLANIFTKHLPGDKLVHIRNLLRMTFILE
ncbi:putative mitochondrial protein, partial [Mucuna pruriens]